MNNNLHHISRRELLKITAAATAISSLPNIALAQASNSSDKQLSALLADFAEEMLRLAPTLATSLGLDSGDRISLKSQLGDASPVGDELWTAQVRSMQSRLTIINRTNLSAAAQTIYDKVQYSAACGMEGVHFPFGGAASGLFGGTSPYPLTQQDGALWRTPEFLDSQHQITNRDDAESYLARVEALAKVLDQETARITQQASQGIAPPDFIARTALGQLSGYRKTAVAEQTLVKSITTRTKKLGIDGDWEARATELVNSKIYPAVDRQIAAYSKATAKSSNIAGVYHLPDGEAYYEWALKLGTSTTRSAREIHAIGLEQNKQLKARIDTILKAQGIKNGTVGERLLALSKDPKRFFADNDQGRDQIIAFCNEKVAAARALMPKISHLGMQAPLVIKRVPQDIEAGAPLGYMNFAALDGSRPAIYYINLKSTTLWPRDQLATLTAHEGIPGHAWQGAYLAEHHAEVPLISSMIGFNAFVEGWALYAEQLVDEFGLYANDPFSQIGYLQAQQFRACRLVVDTGIHAMKWSAEQAIRFLVENTGRGVGAMTSEVHRYCVSPGQACGYKMGHNEILSQRERAKAALGNKFDLAAFNDALVSTGGVPLTVLPTVIDNYIANAKRI